jgi:hypothetical protein
MCAVIADVKNLGVDGAGRGQAGSPGSDGASPYLSLEPICLGTALGERPHADPPHADPPTRFSLGG